ncbi:hypothetical protein VTN49DRAFT_1246 [Thermomyces lanuginosus]|uniref:uncharacterized protein n=1 Tax=Thermomyces lanuginosus TaxID=5541 RepID=UPI0037420C34
MDRGYSTEWHTDWYWGGCGGSSHSAISRENILVWTCTSNPGKRRIQRYLRHASADVTRSVPLPAILIDALGTARSLDQRCLWDMTKQITGLRGRDRAPRS